MSCGIGLRHGSDLALLWLWRRPVAIARPRPLAWEPPYAAGAALKKKKERKSSRHLSLKIHQHFPPEMAHPHIWL